MSSSDDDVKSDADDAPLLPSTLGPGLLAQHPTSSDAIETVAVAKVCPQCGVEYLTSDRFCPRDGSPLRPKAGDDPLIGRVIADRYLMLARLGEGGMGRVYLAEHVKMNRQCAVKVMNPSLVNDGQSATRFAREASNAARILHPNVAAVFDYGEADKIIYLVMEFVDGESLSTILAREAPLDPRRAVDLARQIADGLAAAHELGIVHRDLKPDNVIVAHSRSHREIPKVVDFGIAKAITGVQEDSLTRSGLVIGTPEYMSPEQLIGDPVDARTDIYSLGCILYQMVTGVQAFAADTREQMIRRRLAEPPPHIREMAPGIPRALDTVIAHMLARSPSDRLASAAEARDALDPARVLAGWDGHRDTDLRARPQLKLTSTGFDAHPSNEPTVRLPLQRGERKSRFGVFIVVIAALMLGWVLYWSRDDLGFGRKPTADTSAAKTTAATAPVDTTPVVTKTLPRLDSASALRAKKTADSVADAAKADSLLRAPLERYARAFRSDNLEAVIQAYPTMRNETRDQLRRFFESADRIQATPNFGTITMNGDRAELEFKVRLRYTPTGSLQRTESTLSYHAVLARENGAWKIAELAPPR